MKVSRILPIFFVILFLFSTSAFSQDMDGMTEVGTDPGTTDINRTIDRVRESNDRTGGDMFDRWRDTIFGRRTVDPFDDQSIIDAQEINEDVDVRAKAAADFTANATTVITAGVPGPAGGSAVPAGAKGATEVTSTAVTAGQLVIGEGVNQATAQPTTPAKPGLWQRFKNWVSSWFN